MQDCKFPGDRFLFLQTPKRNHKGVARNTLAVFMQPSWYLLRHELVICSSMNDSSDPAKVLYQMN